MMFKRILVGLFILILLVAENAFLLYKTAPIYFQAGENNITNQLKVICAESGVVFYTPWGDYRCILSAKT